MSRPLATSLALALAAAVAVAGAGAVAACGDPKPAPSKPTRPVKASATTYTVERVVISSTRPSGTSVVSTRPDGTIATTLHVVENGRGPHVEATMTLARDGTIASFAATGHHTMGTEVDETFRRDGARATWKSEEEQGEQEVDGAAFYIPIAEVPETMGYLVEAALKAGGTLPLLPAGEAKVAKVAELEISAAQQQAQTVHCYEIVGLGLTPTYTWMKADGTWFGSFAPWFSVVPKGWEPVIDTLVARQDELEHERDAALAAAHAHRPPAAGIAYTHARVLDVEKGKWIADQTVLVVGDTIEKVGKKVAIPEGAEVVDLAGAALVPGLIDMHSHTAAVDGVLDIASGVTTIRDVGNDPDTLDDLVKRFDEGTAIGPHVVRMGFIEGRNEKAAASKVTAETEEEALAAVEEFAGRGYEGIKIYNSMKPELVPVLAEAAHARGMLVTGHIPVHMLAHEAVAAGYDGIEHINMLFLNFFATHETDTRDTTRFTLVGDQAADFDLASKPVLDFIKMLKDKKTVIDPTLTAFEDLFVGRPGVVTAGLEGIVDRLPVQTRRWFLVGGLPAEDPELYARSWDKILAMVKALVDAKVHVVLGTDHIGGLMLHHEMALFARAGIKPAAILRMATLDAARAIRQEKTIGTIAAGKRADLVVVDGDPLADIAAITRVRSTMRGGVVYTSSPLYAAVGVAPLDTEN